MAKKRKKWEQDIAQAQAISACTKEYVSREQWWDMLRAVQPGDYESLKKVINTKCPSAYTPDEASKTEED